jgi:BMFP domain-containing protein YqiC
MARDITAILQGFIADIAEGKGATGEFLTSLNAWGKEFTEGLREKVEKEVDASVSKLGFVKRDEYDRLAARIAALESGLSVKVKSPVKSPAKKSVKAVKKVAKASPKKRVVQKRKAK